MHTLINYQALTDMELAERIRLRDNDAFAEVYYRYWDVLFRHALKMLKDEDGAADVVQDVFMNIWDKADVFWLNKSLSAFLYIATRNKILSLMNHQKYHHHYLADLEDYLRKGEWQTDEKIRESELKSIIESEVHKLPAKMQQIYKLSRNTYLSYKAIAEEMNVSEGTVKKQIYNALKILRSKLGAFFLLQLLFCFLLINHLI